MATKLDIVAVTGPSAGTRAPLPRDKPLLLGRGSRGVHLNDPAVNLEHARIFYEEKNERYRIEDLRSQSGTIVNGVKLEEEPVTIVEGSEIEIGETLFVCEVQEGLPSWVLPVVAGLLVLVIALAGLGWWTSRPIIYEPVIAARVEVNQGTTTAKLIELPETFIRESGFDHHNLQLLDVTDHDENELSELWLRMGSRESIWTFEADGSLSKLGDFPLGCAERSGPVLPDIVCNGMRYRFDGIGYKPHGHEDGIVVWARPNLEVVQERETARAAAEAEADPDAPPVQLQIPPANQPIPYRISIHLPEMITGFLEERGVTEPVHYIICEGFVDGVAPQALTVSGKVVPLEPGCIRNQQLDGTRLAEFSDGAILPVAYAFTHNGYTALLDDVDTWYSGSADGLFHTPQQHGAMYWLSRPPEPRLGIVRVTFRTKDPLPDDWEPKIASSIAPEAALPDRRHLIGKEGITPPAFADSAIVYDEGVNEFDVDGCTRFEVHTNPWHCRLNKFCTAGKTFATVFEVGCSDSPVPLIAAPYSGGVFAGGTPNYDIRLEVNSIDGGGYDVLRARLGWRPRPKTEEAAGDDE